MADPGSSDAVSSTPCFKAQVQREQLCGEGCQEQAAHNEVENLLISVTHKEHSFLGREYVDSRSDV